MATITEIERKLRPRQIRFARLVASGVIPAHAYPQAGYHPGSRQALDAHASRLVRCGRIKRFIASLHDQEFNERTLSQAARKAKLSEIAVEDIRNERNVPIREPSISAIRELNRMERIGADPVTPGQVTLVVVHDSSRRLNELAAQNVPVIDVTTVQSPDNLR